MIDYDFFIKHHSMNKSDLIEDIDSTLEKILLHAETDPNHSYAYYSTLKNLLENLKDKILSSTLMEQLETGWCYDWGVNYSGADLQLVHYILYEGYPEDPSLEELDQVFPILSVPTSLLTVDEFASLHGVEVVTVRQWIRRGKIRTAKKYGNEWRIPSLTDTPKRGYTSAHYKWSDTLSGLPEDLLYLNEYNEALFTQDDDDKKLFYVFLYNEPAVDGLRTAGKTLECTAAERERIELTIISQPSVHYMQNFIDSICIDLMEVFNSGGDE